MADEVYNEMEMVVFDTNGQSNTPAVSTGSNWALDPQEKIDRILGVSSRRGNNVMDKIDNAPLFELTSKNLNRVGDLNVSEKIMRMLE